jgi:hypothetical protein
MTPLREYFSPLSRGHCHMGGAMIKSPKIFYCPFGFFYLALVGTYFDKMDPNFKKN